MVIAALIHRIPDHHLQSTSPFELARNPLKGLYISPVILN